MAKPVEARKASAAARLRTKVGVKERTREDRGIIDQANVIRECYRMTTKLTWRRQAAVLTADVNANRPPERRFGEFALAKTGSGYERVLHQDGDVETLYPQHSAHCHWAIVSAARAFESVRLSRPLAGRLAERSPHSRRAP